MRLLPCLAIAGLLGGASACAFDPSGISGPPADGPHDASLPPTPIDGPPTPDPDAEPDADLTPTPECPPDYEPSGTTALPSRYRFIDSGATGLAAFADCADDLAPYTSLVVIIDSVENNHVDTITGNRSVWIGVHDRTTEGTYQTAFDQAPLPFTAFDDDEPNNGGNANNDPGEDCVELIEPSLGRWNDNDCEGVNRRYVCECDLTRPAR